MVLVKTGPNVFLKNPEAVNFLAPKREKTAVTTVTAKPMKERTRRI